MSDGTDDIDDKIAALQEKAKGGRNVHLAIGGEIARLTFAKQKAEKRELEASIRRRAKLQKKAGTK